MMNINKNIILGVALSLISLLLVNAILLEFNVLNILISLGLLALLFLNTKQKIDKTEPVKLHENRNENPLMISIIQDLHEFYQHEVEIY